MRRYNTQPVAKYEFMKKSNWKLLKKMNLSKFSYFFCSFARKLGYMSVIFNIDIENEK
jgi:hypothetical protein